MQSVNDKIKKLNNDIDEQQALATYSQLVSFIDSSLANAIAKEGEEKINLLFNTTLSVRDYLKNIISSKNTAKVFIEQVVEILDEEAEATQNKKKEDPTQDRSTKLDQEVE